MSLENHDARAELSPGREISVLNRRPWVFSRGLSGNTGEPTAGEIISVLIKIIFLVKPSSIPTHKSACDFCLLPMVYLIYRH